jgi:hypothetical protein
MPGSLTAAQESSLTGDWALNVAKSRWGNTTRPVSVVLTIDHNEPSIHYRGSVLYADEESREFGFSGAFDGKPYRMSRSFGDGTIILRRLTAHTFESVFTTDSGDYSETARTTLSADGRTLVRKLTVRTPGGRRTWTEVYEKR